MILTCSIFVESFEISKRNIYFIYIFSINLYITIGTKLGYKKGVTIDKITNKKAVNIISNIY